MDSPRSSASHTDASHPPTPTSAFKSQPGLSRLGAALRYSWAGLRHAWQHEAAFRQELALCAGLLPVVLWLPLSAVERVLLAGSLLFVLVVELLNSAIEAVVDRVGMEPHPLAKHAKDLGSAAVLVALLGTLMTWAGLLIPMGLNALGAH
jgi:diacylglycerol kinase (ATP)